MPAEKYKPRAAFFEHGAAGYRTGRIEASEAVSDNATKPVDDVADSGTVET